MQSHRRKKFSFFSHPIKLLGSTNSVFLQSQETNQFPLHLYQSQHKTNIGMDLNLERQFYNHIFELNVIK